MYLYQETPRFFAQCAPEMEELSQQELIQLGATDVQSGYLGWYFSATPEIVYRINYCSRFLIRVLAPLCNFPCQNPTQLYRSARKIEWDRFFNVNQSFAIFSTVSNSSITHSKYAALKLKDAIVDHFREKYRERPNVDTDDPTVWFCLHIEFNRATIHLDTSGGSLHRRGYRKVLVTAPMQETLAAAIVHLSGWDGEQPLYDPMCGSGTLLLEAMMKYCRIPAGYLRSNFGFEHLPDFQPGVWKAIQEDAQKAMRSLPPKLIQGSDIDPKAIQICRTNAKNLPYSENITLTTCDFHDIQGLPNHIILCNPPYGVRMQEGEDLGKFYKDLGDFLKRKCPDSQAYIYFGDREWLKNIGLRPKFKRPLRNGGLDGRLAKFEMYALQKDTNNPEITT